MRRSLPDDQLSPHAHARLARFHPEVVDEVQQAIATHPVVVVGMAWNPHVPRARKLLDGAGIAHHDIDHGNYVTGWKRRLALKLWAGWPTFPMVFVRGTLIGGADCTASALADGSLRRMLDVGDPS